MGLTVPIGKGRIDMCFLIAALALVVALFTGALIAPYPGTQRGLGPCALEPGEWSMMDPHCSEMEGEISLQTIARGSIATAARLPTLTANDLIAR
jgi:hypothetical protein